MNGDTKHWVDETVRAIQALPAKVTILVIRRQDNNDEEDIVLTNAPDAATVAALAKAAIGCPHDSE